MTGEVVAAFVFYTNVGARAAGAAAVANGTRLQLSQVTTSGSTYRPWTVQYTAQVAGNVTFQLVVEAADGTRVLDLPSVQVQVCVLILALFFLSSVPHAILCL